MSSPVLSPLTWRPPYAPTPLVDMKNGAATTAAGGFDEALRNLTTVIQQIASVIGFNVKYFGARGDGRNDDTAAIMAAIAQVVNQGGGIVYFPPGTYMMGSVAITSDVPISIVGAGASTVLMRNANLGAGVGLFDIAVSNVSIQGLTIDGAVTVPKGLQYNVDFNTAMYNNDPMAPALTLNTSIWLHSPATDFSMTNVRVQHTGGYALLIDCSLGPISDVHLVRCQFFNNRPHTFGNVAGQLIYGSWTGGVFVNGSATLATGILEGLLVDSCHFNRNTGNCIWSHVYNLAWLHTGFRIVNNYFLDCGLDAIEPGGVTGGIASGNVIRRVGYICVDDTSQSVPRWLPNFQASAIDSSGLVKSFAYEDNTLLSINGGCIDLDGHGDSVISGNVCRLPYPDEPEYAEDQIALTGPTNSGSVSYGVNAGNTQNTSYGGRWVNISGNTFINLPGGAIRLYATRECLVAENHIVSPDAPLSPPISLGPGGAGVNQVCSGNVIRGNRFSYAPAIAAPFVFEDPTIAAFTAAMVNYVFDNSPLLGTTNAFEFEPNAGSGSGTTANAVTGAATLNVSRGIVTSEALVTAAGAAYTLTLTDPAVRASSNVMVAVSNGSNTGGAALLQGVTPANGSVVIVVLNNGATAFNGTLKIQFAIQ